VKPCASEPVSWLRLERFALGELADAERGVIAHHLAGCPACSECLARIQADDRVLALPSLPPIAAVPPERRARSRRFAWPVWAGLAAAAAAVLLLARPSLDPSPGRVQVKGGAFALELVRRDREGRTAEPSHYDAGDRFKALVTCPPSWRGVAGVAVYQDGKVYTPTPVHALDDCGNRHELPGAFQLDGNTRVLVCVAFAADEPEWRARIARSSQTPPDGSVCAQLAPGVAED